MNNAIDSEVAEEILVALQSEVLDLKDVIAEIADYYCDGLIKRKNEKQDVRQTINEWRYFVSNLIYHLVID